jgi:GWxTD domain-containing protein
MFIVSRAAEPSLRRPLARTLVVLAVVAALLLTLPVQAKKKTPIPEDLAQQYRDWLTSVALLLTDEEREAFLALEADYQRDAFIQRFWRVRDPDPSTARNELKDRWEELSERVAKEFEGALDDRGRMLLLNGPPTASFQASCPGRVYPVEVWFYERSWAIGHEFVLVFYRPHGGGPYRLFHPADGIGALVDSWSADAVGGME